MLLNNKIKTRLSFVIQIAIFLYLFFISTAIFASKSDSINFILRSSLSDSLKITNGLRLINESQFKDKTQADYFYTILETFALKTNKRQFLSSIYASWASYNKDVQKNYSNALFYTTKRMKESERLNDSVDILDANSFLGIHIYAELGLVDEAIKAMKTCVNYTALNSLKNANAYYALGWLEFNLKKYDSALVHLKTSVDIGVKTTPRKDLTEHIGWLGNAYAGVKDYKNAIKYRKEALKLCKENEYEYGVFDCHRYLGQFYYALQQYDTAIYHSNYTFNYTQNKPTTTKQANLVYSGYTLIQACIKSNKLNLGETYIKAMLNPTLTPCQYGSEERVLLTSLLAQFYEAKGDNDKTIYYLKDLLKSKDSADLSKQSVIVNEHLLKNNFEKEQQEQLIEQQKKDFETEAQAKRQKVIIMATIVVLILVSLLLYLSYQSGKQKKISLLQIGEQKREIEHQKEIVDEKNKEIIESINYAKRLQDAILPPLELIKQKLPDSFVYYQPKDIVAGDFYWMEEIGEKLFIAVADSTGHGVPGALVSIVCSNALNRSVKEFGLSEPGLILDKTRQLVLETFSKNDNNVKDGMDVSLVCIKLNNVAPDEIELTWSGANNPLWYVSKINGTDTTISNYELLEIKGDKQPIGLTDNPKKFTTHKLRLQKEDAIYLFTDGYADQFGGPKGKKFKYKPLQELLVQNCKKSMGEQKELLENVLNNWKGEYEQVDDVCVIGIRL